MIASVARRVWVDRRGSFESIGLGVATKRIEICLDPKARELEARQR